MSRVGITGTKGKRRTIKSWNEVVESNTLGYEVTSNLALTRMGGDLEK